MVVFQNIEIFLHKQFHISSTEIISIKKFNNSQNKLICPLSLIKKNKNIHNLYIYQARFFSKWCLLMVITVDRNLYIFKISPFFMPFFNHTISIKKYITHYKFPGNISRKLHIWTNFLLRLNLLSIEYNVKVFVERKQISYNCTP